MLKKSGEIHVVIQFMVIIIIIISFNWSCQTQLTLQLHSFSLNNERKLDRRVRQRDYFTQHTVNKLISIFVAWCKLSSNKCLYVISTVLNNVSSPVSDKSLRFHDPCRHCVMAISNDGVHVFLCRFTSIHQRAPLFTSHHTALISVWGSGAGWHLLFQPMGWYTCLYRSFKESDYYSSLLLTAFDVSVGLLLEEEEW